MTSKQRVFSTSYTTNYSEYIKNKKGIENLKAIKYNNSSNKLINKFTNYEQFIILSKSYYKYKDLNKCALYPTTNLYNSNISYIDKNDENNENNENNECKLLKQVLYPYGNYESNKISNLYFPYKLNLDESCSNKKICPFPFN